jgi:Protein of unknown function (DUF3307)
MEINPTLGILFLLMLLQIKHALADGPLQLQWMLIEKASYGRIGGLVHAGIHGAGSLAALWLYGVSTGPAVALAVADGIIHYHVDFAKESIVRRKRWTPRDTYFWWSLAADQTLHHFTYLAMAAIVTLWTS